MPVWTIAVGGYSRKYKTLSFDRKLDMNSPTDFRAKIESTPDILFMDRVEIMRDGTTEWVGYVEEMETVWESDGVYLNLWGRDNSMILWKKYTEDFSNFVEKTAGFFGKVNIIELLKLMLRTPKSDLTDSVNGIYYPNNKEGWGLDYSTNMKECRAYRTGIGDAKWVKLRRRGYGWKNTGGIIPTVTLVVNGVYYNNWTGHGVSPYLHDQDTSNYIDTIGRPANTNAEFTFTNLPVLATSVAGAILTVTYKFDGSWMWWLTGGFDCFLYIPSSNSYQFLFNASANGGTWSNKIIDISNYLKTVSDVNGARVLFTTTSGQLASYVTYAALAVNYLKDSSQSIDDFFSVSFNPAQVCGIYIESRSGNDSYPRNYRIVTESGNVAPIAGAGWTELDPTGTRIVPNADKTQIEFTSFPSELAYNYKDFGIGGLGTFNHQTSFKPYAVYPHTHLATIYCVSKTVESRYSLEATLSKNFFAVDVVSEVGGNTYLRFILQEGGSKEITYSDPITVGSFYYMRVVGVANTSISVKLYNSALMDEPHLIYSHTFNFAGPSAGLRYLFNCLTYGTSTLNGIFADGFETGLPFEPPWTRESPTTPPTSIAPFRDTGVKHSGSASVKFYSVADEKSWIEKELPFDVSDEFDVNFWLYMQSDPPSEAISVNLKTNGYDWYKWDAGWGNAGALPWLDNDNGDTSFIHCVNEPQFLGKQVARFTLDNLNPKYESASFTTVRLHLKGRLYDGINGHATNIDIRPYYSFDGITWYYLAGDPKFTFSTTGYVDTYINFSSVLNTITKVNTVYIKLEFAGVGGSTGVGWGGCNMTYMYLEVAGTGYWGRVNMSKIFDKNTAGIGCPNVNIFGAMQMITGNDGKWHSKIWGHQDGSPYYWDGTVLVDNSYNKNIWHHFSLRVFRAAAGAAKVQLWYWNGATWIKVSERTGLTNNIMGVPNTFDICAECTNGGFVALGVNADDIDVQIISNQVHGNTLIQSIGGTVTEILSVTNNTFRDIIHSWVPMTLDNLRIELTAPSDHDWAITQIYVYKAENPKYAAFWDESGSGEPPEPPSPYQYIGGPYIEQINVHNTFLTPTGPINIGKQRLFDCLYYIVQKAYQASGNTYIPYEWWMGLDEDNTLHVATQKGSDKSSSINFIRDTHLGSCKRKKFINDTAQRVYVAGQGEQKKQQDNSLWIEDVDAMNTVRTFFEEIEQDKTAVTDTDGTPRLARIVGSVYLGRNSSIRDQIEINVNKDSYASMAYDVGDIVTVIDSFTGVNGAFRIWNINKSVDSNGEQVIITLGYAKYKYEDEIQTFYKFMKGIGVVGVVKPDWTAEGIDSTQINANSISQQSLYNLNQKNDTVTAPTVKTDPSWYMPQDGVNGRLFICGNDWFSIRGATSGALSDFLVVLDKNSAGEDSTVSLAKSPHFTADMKMVESGNTWNANDNLMIGIASAGQGFWFKIVKNPALEPTASYYCYMEYMVNGMTEISRTLIRTLKANVKYRFEIIVESDTNMVVFNVYELENDVPEDYPPSGIAETSQLTTMNMKPLFMNMNSNPTGGYTALTHIYNYKLDITVIKSGGTV